MNEQTMDTLGQHDNGGTDSKFLRIVATVVSYILHPVFMPVLMAWVIYQVSPVSFVQYEGKALSMVFIQIALTTIFFPILVVLLLKGLGFIDSILLRKNKERIIPLLATLICYWWISHVFKNLDAPVILQVLLRGAYWGIIVLFMCSIFFKISMHTMAAGGMLGVLIVLLILSPVSMTVPLFIGIVVAGISGTARMLLGAHTQFEIWSGYILGILSMLAAYWYIVL
ncbi:MAG: hypothetical protein KDC07_03470 [Chitinophagaceae bacterium]|nr:hypothetical protein [Chitinophagaceae bacterium]MCB9045129.1 hypothetical protein [Chitinophagales bacterium]